jgi:riboflavin synthase
MFTGIIEEVGAVQRRSGADLDIMAETVLDGLKLGDSVAVNGACLTVAAINASSFVVQVSPESLSCTTLSGLRPGHAVNLERAMRADGRFDGHFVQGHVDGVGQIEGVQKQGEFSLWRFRAPAEVACYIIPKGSITIDGISLTVVEPEGDRFSVALIPATFSNTTLPSKSVGDPVNMEADMLGKHIYHYLRVGAKEEITVDFLSRHGFA